MPLVDAPVHSVANFHRASLEETDERLWDSSMSVNARAITYWRAKRHPSCARHGPVVPISNFLDLDPPKNFLDHSVSKAAVEGLAPAASCPRKGQARKRRTASPDGCR